MRLRVWVSAAVALGLLAFASAASADEAFKPRDFKVSGAATPSGSLEFREVDFGTGITECPQARLKKLFNEPLDLRRKDAAEQYSENGNDLRTNEEYTCFPQNETAVDTNPANGHKNIVVGQNDYRLGTASSGFGASNDGGQTWYGGIIPFPSSPATAGNQGFLVSGGDPAVVFDRDGVVYYAMLGFNRNNDDNGIFVSRSTNGGFTWSRACVAQGAEPNTVCGGPGDVRAARRRHGRLSDRQRYGAELQRRLPRQGVHGRRAAARGRRAGLLHAGDARAPRRAIPRTSASIGSTSRGRRSTRFSSIRARSRSWGRRAS